MAIAKLRRECAKWLNALTALTNLAGQADRLAAVSTAAVVGHYRVANVAPSKTELVWVSTAGQLPRPGLAGRLGR
jgi:hypothetical protein